MGLASHWWDVERPTAGTKNPHCLYTVTNAKKYKWFDSKSPVPLKSRSSIASNYFKRQLYLLKPGEIFQPTRWFYLKDTEGTKTGVYNGKELPTLFNRTRLCRVEKSAKPKPCHVHPELHSVLQLHSTAQTLRLRQTHTLVTLHHQLHVRLLFWHLAILRRILQIWVIPPGWTLPHLALCTKSLVDSVTLAISSKSHGNPRIFYLHQHSWHFQ